MNQKHIKRRSPSNGRSSYYASLEPRHLLASIYLNPTNGILFIAGDSGVNVGQVDVVNGNVIAQIDGMSLSAANSEVNDIVFIGYDGNDVFTNLSSRSANMYGQLGNDTLVGGSGDDNLVGGPGNDNIQGNDGDDRVVGAFGNDELFGGNGNDRMFGTAGQNTIFGGNGDDVIYGSDDIDEIFGEQGADKIYALGGDDIIETGAGGVTGGSFAQGDLAMGHGGNDTITGNSGLDIFYGGDGNDIMTGGIGENRIHGQGGNDTMVGGPLGDYMTGAAGNDSFEGRGSVDFFNVGDGDDTVVYSMDYNPSDVVVQSSGASRVQNELLNGVTFIQFNDRTISGSQAFYSTQDEAIFSRLNGYRAANSQAFLSKPSDLADYALNWSRQMALQGQEINSSIAQQQTLLTNGRTVVGENVASVEDSGQSAAEIANYFFDHWQSNATENSRMLRSDFSEVGVAIFSSGGTWWATQIFVG